MNDEAALVRALQEHPEDAALRLVFADWLEEQGDPRSELLRLQHTLTQSVEVPDRIELEGRLRSLVASGVQPVGPFFTNSLGMTFAWIPAGTFLMGSASNGNRDDDAPQHQVLLTHGFYLAIHLVTQVAWRTIVGNNPSHHPGDDLPVEQVSWHSCQEFLRKLGARDGQTYRLPTEAEWEYACRAGTTTPFYFGETISTDQANFDGSYAAANGIEGVNRDSTTPVGSFPANAWGLHDLHGNVQEWTGDWYGGYPAGKAADPHGPEEGDSLVVRGGSFHGYAMGVRSAHRNWYMPTTRLSHLGFRATFTPCALKGSHSLL